MTQTVEYRGESTFAVDAIIRALVDDELTGGDWYVVVHLDGGEKLKGWLTEYHDYVGQPFRAVMIKGKAKNGYQDDGERLTFQTDHVRKLVIP